MLFMHQIKSTVDDISLSIDELIATFQPLLKDTATQETLKAYIPAIQRVAREMESLDEKLYQFSDKTNHPLDELTLYDLNSCQVNLNDLADLIADNSDDLETEVQKKLDTIQHVWRDNYLNNFTLWFKTLLGENLVICKSDLVFEDEDQAHTFLKMLKNTLQAEALLFNRDNNNRAAAALLSSGMLYGECRAIPAPPPCSMRIASETGKILDLPTETYADQHIIQTLGWQTKTSSQQANVQRYLNYKSRSRRELQNDAQQARNQLQFSNVYTQKAPTTVNIPELPLGIALACAQRLIDDGYANEADVYSDNGRFGVITNSALLESNRPMVINKLNALFSYFLSTYSHAPQPAPSLETMEVRCAPC